VKRVNVHRKDTTYPVMLFTTTLTKALVLDEKRARISKLVEAGMRNLVRVIRINPAEAWTYEYAIGSSSYPFELRRSNEMSPS